MCFVPVLQKKDLNLNEFMAKLVLQPFRNHKFPVKATLSLLAAMIALSAFANKGAKAANVPKPHAEVRLLPGSLTEGTAYAGVDVTLEPGVKTYWRMPGDSGLPPIFDWSGSENLLKATVEWPLPERIADPAGTVFGYHDRVVFPVRIEAKDVSKPVHLSLKLDFAVCAEICVPLSAQTRVTLEAGPVDPSFTKDIETFRSRIPIASTIGGPIKPALKSLTETGPDLLTVTLDSPVKDIIVEGPDGWYFGDASPQSGSVWQIKILQKPMNGALGGLPLTLTLVGTQQATETVIVLDANGAIR
jgi:DsbC/DsbD-like thiol-disulfide interchange protein